MKNLILAFAISFFLFSCTDIKPKIPEIILSGQIENFNEETIKIIQDELEIEFSINENGAFTDTIYDFEEGKYILKIGNEFTELYLKDGTNIFFTVDANDFDNTIKYSGIGANENNYLAKKISTYAKTNYWQFSKEAEKVFLAKADSFISSKNLFIDEYKAVIPEFDQEFYALEKLNNNYLGAYLKEMYKQTHSYYMKKDSFEVSEDFYTYRKNIALENKEALNTKFYPRFVEKYISNNIEKNDTTEEAFEALRLINREFQNNELKKEFIYQSATINLKTVKKLDEYWSLVSYMVTDKAKLKKLKKSYNKIKKIQPNQPSPLTTFKDKDGNEFELADFKGSFIYIDCWAQWCGPCKAEAPFLKKLEEKYAANEIIFLKLSLDENQDAWKEYITKNDVTKNSFIIDNHFESEFAKAYLINSIPRFILLDKDLKIIDSNAKRPSDKDLQKQFDDLLSVK